MKIAKIVQSQFIIDCLTFATVALSVLFVILTSDGSNRGSSVVIKPSESVAFSTRNRDNDRKPSGLSAILSKFLSSPEPTHAQATVENSPFSDVQGDIDRVMYEKQPFQSLFRTGHTENPSRPSSEPKEEQSRESAFQPNKKNANQYVMNGDGSVPGYLNDLQNIPKREIVPSKRSFDSKPKSLRAFLTHGIFHSHKSTDSALSETSEKTLKLFQNQETIQAYKFFDKVYKSQMTLKIEEQIQSLYTAEMNASPDSCFALLVRRLKRLVKAHEILLQLPNPTRKNAEEILVLVLQNTAPSGDPVPIPIPGQKANPAPQKKHLDFESWIDKVFHAQSQATHPPGNFLNDGEMNFLASPTAESTENFNANQNQQSEANEQSSEKIKQFFSSFLVDPNMDAQTNDKVGDAEKSSETPNQKESNGRKFSAEDFGFQIPKVQWGSFFVDEITQDKRSQSQHQINQKKSFLSDTLKPTWEDLMPKLYKNSANVETKKREYEAAKEKAVETATNILSTFFN